MTRVLLAALSAISRAGLEALLHAEPEIEVVGSVAGSASIGSLIEEHQPDVLVLELEDPADDLPPELGALPGVAVVLLADGPPGPDALRSSVRGVLSREMSGGELAAAVQAAGKGLAVLSPAYLETLLAAPAGISREATATPGQSLSPREVEVLRMLADGLGNKQIAYRMSISEHTVKFHVASIMGKLRATSRTEAVTLGIRQGLILL